MTCRPLLTLILIFATLSSCTKEAPSPSPPIQTIDQHLTTSTKTLAQYRKRLSELHKLSDSLLNNEIQSADGAIKLEQSKELFAPQLFKGEKLLFDFKDSFIQLDAKYISRMALCKDASYGAAILSNETDDILLAFKADGASKWESLSNKEIVDLTWNGGSPCNTLSFLEMDRQKLYLRKFNYKTNDNVSLPIREEQPLWGALHSDGELTFVTTGKAPNAKWLVFGNTIQSPKEIPSSQTIKDIAEVDGTIFVLRESPELTQEIQQYASLDLLLNNQNPIKSFEDPRGAILEIQPHGHNLLASKIYHGRKAFLLFKKEGATGMPRTVRHPKCSLTVKKSFREITDSIPLYCEQYNTPKQEVVYSNGTLEAPKHSLNSLPNILHQKIKADDGATEIPVTILPAHNHQHTMIITYGSYGETILPHHDPWWTFLRENGVQIVIAHVRGGGYNGRLWHQAGIKENKLTGARDLITVAESFKKQNVLLIAYGKSAGAWPIVASLGLEKSPLFEQILLEAPLVDPLTQISPKDHFYQFEIEEWGDMADPFIQKLYKYAKSKLFSGNTSLPKTLIRLSSADSLIDDEQVFDWITKLSEARSSHFVLDATNSASHQGEVDLYDEIAFEARKSAFMLGE